MFVPDKPLEFTNGVVLNFQLKQNHGGWNSDDNQNHNLGRFRLSVTRATNAVADPIPAGVRGIFNIPHERRTPAQIATVFGYWRTTMGSPVSDGESLRAVGDAPSTSSGAAVLAVEPGKKDDAASQPVAHAGGVRDRDPATALSSRFKEANDKIEALWKQWPEGSPTLSLLVRTGSAPEDEARQTHLLKRGDWLKPGEPVAAGVPAFLHPLPEGADGSRLLFAKWLVDRKSPTTARAIVNRIWQGYFGIGLVETSEDFGNQGAAPSHPELLDWLACEFMDRGWSIKAMHRLIANSAVYKQGSHVTPDLFAKDQYNRLLARGPRFRVEGEIVRDIALSASGLMNPVLGGRSVYPPAPDFLFQPPASYGPKVWKEEPGADRYRRSLYTFKFRSVPYPVLQNFDAPNGDFSCVRRQRSNTPLQALTTLNETIFMECAQGLARTTLERGGQTDEERITYAFRRVLSRPPTPEEKAELAGLLQRQRQRIAEGWVNPLELGTGKNEVPANLPKGVTPTLLAAHTAVSRVLLNLDETITKE